MPIFFNLTVNKTEVIVFGKVNDRHRVIEFLNTKGLKPKATVRNLGVILGSDLSFNQHIKSICKSAFYRLKNIAKLRGFMSRNCGIDYCNSFFTGLPKKHIKKLQLIQNAAARVLTRTRRTEHITPILKSRAASVGNEFSHRFVESHDY